MSASEVGVALSAESFLLAFIAVFDAAGLARISVPKLAFATLIAILCFRIIWTGIAITFTATSVKNEVPRVAGSTGSVRGAFGAAALTGLAFITDPPVTLGALHRSSAFKGVFLILVLLHEVALLVIILIFKVVV